MVQGFPWCLNEPKRIGLTNLVAKVLCKKHNSAASELDSVALDAFNVFREAIRIQNVRGKMKRPPQWNVKRFEIDGPRLERWFLKTLINLTFRSQWMIGPGSPAGTPSKEWVESAYGLREFVDGSGLYLAGEVGEQIDSMDRVKIEPMTDGNELVAGRFNFRGYTFFLSLIPEKVDKFGQSHLLYRQARLDFRVQERLSHVITIRGW